VRKVLPWALAVALLLGISHLGLAEKPKPVMTMSFSGYDEVMKDIDLIGKLGDLPQLGKLLEGQLQQQEGPRMLLPLIDKGKPWGVVVSMGDESPEPVVQAILPLTDVKPIVQALQQIGIQAKESGGTYEVQAGPRTVVFKQKGRWTLVASSKDALADIPEEPASLLGGLNEKYDLAVSVAIKNIPAAIRDGAMFPLTMAFQMAMQQRMPGEGEGQYAFRSRMAEQLLKQITEAIKDLDTILLGLSVDRKANAARLDLVTTVLPGSKMAKKLARSADLKTDFAGLADPNAALLFTLTRKMDEEDVAQAKSNTGLLRTNLLAELGGLPGASAEDAKLVKQLAGDLMDVLEKTVEGGKLDGGLKVKLAPKNLQVVAAVRVADGAKLDKVVKQVIERVGKENPAATQLIKLDAETHQGVRFHTLTVSSDMVPSPHEKDQFSKVFGDKVTVILGIGDDSVYLAVSPDAAKTLKEVIDKSKSASDKSTPPMQLSVAATPIAQFVAEVGDPGAKQGAGMLLKVVSASAGKDHVKLTATLVPNGSQARLELEEGILRVIGTVPKMRLGLGGGGAPVPQP